MKPKSESAREKQFAQNKVVVYSCTVRVPVRARVIGHFNYRPTGLYYEWPLIGLDASAGERQRAVGLIAFGITIQ